MGQQVKLTRQALEKCVNNYKHTKASWFVNAAQLKPKQIENAIAKFAPNVKPKDVVAVMDTTLFGSAKDGFLITLTHMYGKTMGRQTIDLNRMCKVTRRNSYLDVFYPDGSKESCFVTIFDEDLLNFLKLVIEERARLNEEAEKSAQDALMGQVAEKLKQAMDARAEGIVEAPPEPDIILEDIVDEALVVDTNEDVSEEESVEESEEDSRITPTPAFDPIDEVDEGDPQADNDGDALFAQGQKLFMAKDYAGAIAVFQQAADKGNQKARQFLGQLKAIVGSDS